MTVVKIVELIGSSPKSWEEAAGNAVMEAAKTVSACDSDRSTSIISVTGRQPCSIIKLRTP
ncbi:MAG: dodecin family protein [Candidatus Bathyarchaeota archaeon]|nr:dodecin family protein [Candidatus Bathyarchaeota archaeon]